MWHIPSEPPIEKYGGPFSRCKQQPTVFFIGKSIPKSAIHKGIWFNVALLVGEEGEKDYGTARRRCLFKNYARKRRKVTKYEIKTITQKMKNIKIDKKRKRLIGDGEMNWERRRK
jgi:hypothetical protein